MNKRGIFFTITAIMLLSLFFASFTLYENSQNRRAVQNRVGTMNDFLFSAEKDLSRKVYITSYRILFILQNKIIEDKSYLPNLDLLFEEGFYNGTINGVPQEWLLNYNYTDIEQNAEASGDRINVNLNISNPHISISQSDPWHVKISLIVDILMRDNSNLALWNRTSTINAYIPITSFEDPVYYIETGYVYSKKIKQSPFTVFVNVNDVSNLSAQSLNSYYYPYNKAPSFLDRMKGNLSSQNLYGVESFVNLQEVGSQMNYAVNKSNVDYIYFDETNNPVHYGVNGMPNWFRLDQEHLNHYGADALKHS